MMRIDVTGSETDDVELLHHYVTQRLLFVLSRFGGQITRVGVRLVQMQPVPGEFRLGCRLTIRLVSGRKVFVEVSDTDPYAAIDQVVDRAQRLVGLRVVKPQAGRANERSAAVDDAGPEPDDYPRRRRKKEPGRTSVGVNRKGDIR